MLNKPTMPVPFNTIVDTGDNITTFNFSCELFNDKAQEIDLYILKNMYNLTKDVDYTITNKRLSMLMTKDKTYPTGISGKTNTFSGLNTPVTYTWKIRQIGNPDIDENINIGYGFTQNGGTWQIKHNPAKPTSSNYYDALKFYIYKIRPHVDMYEFLPNEAEIQAVYRTWVKMDYLNQPTTLSEEKYTGKNENISYWINAGDKHVKILGYFYGFEDSVFKASGSTIMLNNAVFLKPGTKSTTMSYDPLLEVDDYGNPLFAYIITDIPISGGTINKSNMVDVEYSITTNYIDSDEFTFKTKTKPTLTMKDFDTNIDSYLYDESSTTVYSPSKSVINLALSYTQAQGGYISQHQTKLFDVTIDDNLLDDTGVIFDEDYQYSYRMLLPNKVYRLDIYLTDSFGKSIFKHIDIAPTYTYASIDIPIGGIFTSYLKKRNSCLIQMSRFTTSFSIDLYEVYKLIGENSIPRYIGSMPYNEKSYLEDYIVGSLCDYQYYICPMGKLSDGSYYILSVIKTDVIRFNNQSVRVIGLIGTDDPTVFNIDTDNVWTIALNINNEGFSHTIGKTYSDTLSRFPVEVKGNSYYRSMNIEGMLGKVDCNSFEYIDTYDNILDWEKFINNGNPKAVIDLRGIVTIGSFDSNSFRYQETINHEASISVSFKQLMDENEVTILARNTELLPGAYSMLLSGNAQILLDSNGFILYALSEE